MQKSRYVMRDLNRRKIDDIMSYNVASRRRRSRSVFEFGVFTIILTTYLWALTVTT